MEIILPNNFTENDAVFDEDTDETFVSLVNDSIIKPLGGKVFIRNKKGEFKIYMPSKKERGRI